MKKVIKSKIFYFVLGALLFGSIGVYASQILSKDIEFTPTNSNWSATNVEDALNDLYNNSKELLVGEFNSALGSASIYNYGLGNALDINNDYITFDSSTHIATINKSGTYKIRYSIYVGKNQNSQPAYYLHINDEEKDSLTVAKNDDSHGLKEYTVTLNENDKIMAKIKGGGVNFTFFATRIIYLG